VCAISEFEEEVLNEGAERWFPIWNRESIRQEGWVKKYEIMGDKMDKVAIRELTRF
jgi:hypothetical protein